MKRHIDYCREQNKTLVTPFNFKIPKHHGGPGASVTVCCKCCPAKVSKEA